MSPMHSCTPTTWNVESDHSQLRVSVGSCPTRTPAGSTYPPAHPPLTVVSAGVHGCDATNPREYVEAAFDHGGVITPRAGPKSAVLAARVSGQSRLTRRLCSAGGPRVVDRRARPARGMGPQREWPGRRGARAGSTPSMVGLCAGAPLDREGRRPLQPLELLTMPVVLWTDMAAATWAIVARRATGSRALRRPAQRDSALRGPGTREILARAVVRR